MPSSMIFAGLVVIWLFILVPAVARHRQEVARPSTAALSGRVLERPRQRRDPEQGHDPERGRDPEVSRRLEVDVMDQMDQQRSVPDPVEDRFDEEPVSAVRYDDPVRSEQCDEALPEDRDWERSPPRYRRGRGGFDPEAAALTARARYAFRQRVVLAMLVLAVGTGLIAGFAVPGLWWLHGAVDIALVGYLGYLRRQVRLEEAIRLRRAARMAGARRHSVADDPELDEWARRGREAVRPSELSDPYAHEDDDEGGRDGPDDEHGDDHGPEPDLVDEDEAAGRGAELGLDHGRADELATERPERVRGTGESLGENERRADQSPALPRLTPAPPLPLPAGTALVEALDDEPALQGLDAPARPGYRRAVGQ